MEYHLHKHVPQFVVKLFRVVLVNGVQRFVGLLYKMLAQALMGLLQIPRAAVFSAQPLHYAYKLLKAVPPAFF